MLLLNGTPFLLLMKVKQFMVSFRFEECRSMGENFLFYVMALSQEEQLCN